MRALDPALVDDAVARYVSGQSLPQVCADLPIGQSTLSRVLRRRGIETRGIKKDVPVGELIALYRDGASVLALSKLYGISRPAVLRRLTAAEEPLRDQSAAHANRLRRMSSDERRALTAAANDALRGKPMKESILLGGAATRQRDGQLASRYEVEFADWLRELDVSYTAQKAVGRYNLDFAIGPVAVEILGGHWHSTSAKRSSHDRRTPYLFDRGWHVLFVWATSDSSFSREVAEYAVAYADLCRRHPTTASQYRVIGGHGDLIFAGSAQDYELTGIPTPGHA